MSVITYCDACRKEVGTHKRRVELRSHVGHTGDMEYYPPIGHFQYFDLCNTCSNIVETAAYDAILQLRVKREGRPS